MILSFSIRNREKDIITITGLTQETNEYLPEDYWIPKYYNYRYTDCVTINIVYQITTKDKKTFKVLFNKHDIWLDESIVQLPQDGLYSISHIVLPTVEWLEKVKIDAPSLLEEYSKIYVSDGEKVYEYINSEYKEVEPELIAEINTSETTISKAENSTFSIWELQKCYIYLCNQILLDKTLKCIEHVDKNIVFDRDLVWMTLNIIKYHLELGQAFEAQRLIEQMNYCHGICKKHSNKSNNLSGCGCS